VKDLLILLGKRVQKLRAAKGWSQEEFAHVAGFHRTYIGQIERGEKNIGFSNLVKLAGVLDVTLSDLLMRLEEGGPPQSNRAPRARKQHDSRVDLLAIQRLVKRLEHQRAEMDRTIRLLGEVTSQPKVD